MARLFSLVVLLALAGAIAAFAYQNRGAVDVQFLNWGAALPLAGLAGVAYGLGMVSGWAVVGLFRRSWRRLTAEHHHHAK
jgi:lipopolysaccharide assembly protein A